MANIIVNIGSLLQGGRLLEQDIENSKTWRRYKALVLAASPIQFQFPQGQATANRFGIPRFVYVENSENNFEANVMVQGTEFGVPIPANSSGFYKIDAIDGDTITFSTSGNSTGPVEIRFYNYDQTPFVWYKFGSTTTAVTIADGADIAEGSVADPAVTNPASSASVIALLKGILTEIIASGVGTAVTIANGADVALGATTSVTVTNPATNATLISYIRGILTQLQAAIPAGAAIIGKVGIDQTTPGTTNGVQVNAALPAGTNTIGNVGFVSVGTSVQGDSGNVANAAAVATLAGAAGKTTYITGFCLSASGATLGNDVSATITGLLGGTKTYTFTFPAGALVAASPINVQFSRPLPASAVNTAIVITLPAGGAGNTNASATAEGYQL